MFSWGLPRAAKIKKTKKNFVFFIFTVYVGFEQADSRKSQEFLYFYFATKQSGGLFTASACRAKFILRRANPTVSALFSHTLGVWFFYLQFIFSGKCMFDTLHQGFVQILKIQMPSLFCVEYVFKRSEQKHCACNRPRQRICKSQP